MLPSKHHFLAEQKSFTEDLVRLDTKKELYEEKLRGREQTRNELMQYEDQWHRLKELNALIGKDEFKNFALSLIEKQIITLANRELRSLCQGRYQLLQVEKARGGQEFYVMDRQNEGLWRKATTLSGGETFMVSLAMALALAELTRGQTQLESFFIDEGFGTLDNEAIEEVLEVLFTVRSRGKQIGLISHITSLTDRISHNIHLEKSPAGYAQMQFIEN